MAPGVLGARREVVSLPMWESSVASRSVVRRVARWVLVLPILILVLFYRLSWTQFTTVSRTLALVPGYLGVWWRARWYRLTLAECGENLHVDWMAAFKTSQSKVGNNVYVGTFCWISWASIGDNVMLGGHVVVLSGAKHHQFDRLDIPMRAQDVQLSQVTIGHDVWVGNGAIVMADIAPGTVIGAGSVVTRTPESYTVAAGVPARVLRRRGERTQVDAGHVRTGLDGGNGQN